MTEETRAGGCRSPTSGVDREAVARIIETVYWPLVDKHGPSNEYWNERIQASLAKADAILAISQPSPVEVQLEKQEHSVSQSQPILASNGQGEAEPSGACRRCVECEGEDHHWMYVGDEDEAGGPVMSCKHCDTTRPVEDDDE